jgi:hypothetical protein
MNNYRWQNVRNVFLASFWAPLKLDMNHWGDEIVEFVSRKVRIIAEDPNNQRKAIGYVAKLICAISDYQLDTIRSICVLFPTLSNCGSTDLGIKPYSLLHYAVVKDSVELVELLLFHESSIQLLAPLDVNATCMVEGTVLTPLHLAALRGERAVARTLLVAGANPRTSRGKGVTVLHDCVASAVESLESSTVALESEHSIRETASFRQQMRRTVERVADGGLGSKRRSTLVSDRHRLSSVAPSQTNSWANVKEGNNAFVDICILLVQFGADIDIRTAEGCPIGEQHQPLLERIRELSGGIASAKASAGLGAQLMQRRLYQAATPTFANHLGTFIGKRMEAAHACRVNHLSRSLSPSKK